jgi:hypothetical protein
MPPWPRLHRQLAAGLRRQSVVLPSAARIGVGLTFAVLGWNPPLWVVVLAVAIAQFAVELVIATHYGLAVTAITVLALCLFHLGTPTEDVGAALVARLVDTAIGAALALLLRRLLWPRATLVRLPQRQARVVSAVFAEAWSPSPRRELPEARRALQGELAALRTVNADALADAGGADAGWPVSAAAEDLAFLALSLPAQRPAPPPAVARAFLDHLDALAAALTGPDRPPTGTPALPDHPRTVAAATAALTTSVADTWAREEAGPVDVVLGSRLRVVRSVDPPRASVRRRASPSRQG